MAVTKEELQERAQLARILESLCKIEYPTADELNFRIAIMKKLGLQLGLKELRSVAVEGPVTQTPARPKKG